MIKLLIQNNTCTISGDFPLDIVREATSYTVPNYKFLPLYRAGHWDGKKSLFSKKTSSFPSGLVSVVVKALKESDSNLLINIEDSREQSPPAAGNNGFGLKGINFGEGKFSYQLGAAQSFIKAKRGILKIATNGGKTAIASAITKQLSVPTLFLVSSVDLVKQTRKVFATRLGLPLDDIGFIGDNNLQLGSWITVGTPDTLINRLDDKIIRKFLDRIDLVFADEVHTAGSETFYEVLDAIPAYYRCGLSGTPLNRSDGANLKIIAQTGDVCFEVPNKQLIELGVSARPHIEFVRVDKPDLSKHKGLNWHSVDKIAITENKELNLKIVNKVNWLLAKGLYPIVLIDKIEHGEILEKLLKKSGIRVKFSFGDLDTDEREKFLKQYADRDIDCLIGSSILDTGIDCPEIDAIVFASGGKSVVRTLQRIGRGMRIRPDKDKVYIVDFANFCHKWLTKHSLERIKTYKKEDCFIISVVDD